MKTRVTLFTYLPSPHQVELFDAIAARGEIDLHVVYVIRANPKRPWGAPQITHSASFIEDLGIGQAMALTDESALVIFSWYRHPVMRTLMKHRTASRQAWCFWGEAPGFKSRGVLGAAYRRLVLGRLLENNTTVWGMGKWAVERYKSEFGSRRAYLDMPYFSDLERFRRASVRSSGMAPRTVLYCGALVKRKGVDVLARAWPEVVRASPGCSLHILGDGPLRGSMEKALSAVSGTVTFHGSVDWAPLPDYYARADILCAPSRYDGWGMVIPEALASGLPVVGSSEMGAIREMVVEGVNGWIIQPADARALAARLTSALSASAEDHGRMRQAAVESSAPFDVEVGARRFTQAALEAVRV